MHAPQRSKSFGLRLISPEDFRPTSYSDRLQPQDPLQGVDMISIPELAVLSLAGYRATQLVVHDTILDTPRSWAFDWHSRKTESPVRTALVTLLSCVYCMGWWLSGLLLAAYLYATGHWDLAGLGHWFNTGDLHAVPIATHGIEWFAVAGGAVIINRVDDTLSRVAP